MALLQRWLALEEHAREEFRSTLQSYIRLYGYISQLITFHRCSVGEVV